MRTRACGCRRPHGDDLKENYPAIEDRIALGATHGVQALRLDAYLLDNSQPRSEAGWPECDVQAMIILSDR